MFVREVEKLGASTSRPARDSIGRRTVLRAALAPLAALARVPRSCAARVECARTRDCGEGPCPQGAGRRALGSVKDALKAAEQHQKEVRLARAPAPQGAAGRRMAADQGHEQAEATHQEADRPRLMKILFLARHFSYLRFFESAIAELAERGHALHLSADREESLGGAGTGRASRRAISEGDGRLDARPTSRVRGPSWRESCGSVSTICGFSIRATTRRPASEAARRSERRRPSAGLRACRCSVAREDDDHWAGCSGSSSRRYRAAASSTPSTANRRQTWC